MDSQFTPNLMEFERTRRKLVKRHLRVWKKVKRNYRCRCLTYIEISNFDGVWDLLEDDRSIAANPGQRTPGINRYGTAFAHSSQSFPNSLFRIASSTGILRGIITRPAKKMANITGGDEQPRNLHLINHALPKPGPASCIPNHLPDNQEERSGIGRVANDTIRPSRDKLVVFEEGDMDRELLSHLAIAPIPDRGTQHHQRHRKSGGRSKFDAVWMFTVWQQESRNSLRPSGLRCSRQDDANFYDCIHPVSGLGGGQLACLGCGKVPHLHDNHHPVDFHTVFHTSLVLRCRGCWYCRRNA
jgi:hypothetical protein